MVEPAVLLVEYRLGAGPELELELSVLSSLSLRSELEQVDSESLFTFFPASLHAFLGAFFFAFFFFVADTGLSSGHLAYGVRGHSGPKSMFFFAFFCLRFSLAFSARASSFKYC